MKLEINDHDKDSREKAASYFSNRGLAYYQVEKFEDSLNDLNRAIQYFPNEPIYYLNRGNVFHEIKNYKFAHWDYDRAIEIEPNNPWYWHSKGLSFEA